ncbi:RPII140-upstream gene protein [Pseudomyrmex gracilis]|uniref:RPII140-upstream gene protein n=1 Tax=Pseudomyrmex gracilis TaxID=219809 RepID=UPI000994EE30|nr:RPII140-upstream gene protein [Pseudomyrmex gracilis]XP_020299453.1 RPII140-upstream gene protein [Pseudomyrmex gracilis]XP_020299454.1 RPII140-upstream gene protein [Pseudomyrmex gracilis]
MTRYLALTRSPMLMTLFPFGDYDKPINERITKLDECGWDRVKKIYQLTEHRLLTKELHSIINTTLTSFVCGMGIGGILATKKTVNDFIANNEATRYPSHFDAKRNLQQRVAENFLKSGFKIGTKLGLFCLIFSSVATSMTAYRGKLTVGNYVLGGSISGFLFRINLGLRGGLVGAGIGSILGGIGGCVTVLTCKLTGISMDQMLEAQEQMREAANEVAREKIKKHLNKEALGLERKNLKEAYEISEKHA